MANELLPVVCTLDQAAAAARKGDLLPELVRRATACEEHGETIRLCLPTENLADVAAVIDAERRCCRFPRFDVTVEPGEGPVWLTRGPPGARAFLGWPSTSTTRTRIFVSC